MRSSLSNLVNNLGEGIHKIKCKYCRMIKAAKLVELNTNIGSAFLNTLTLKMIYRIQMFIL